MTELLTSLDVVNQSFKKSMRGYDSAEVDEFLDHISESLQIYAQKTKDAERELAEKEASLAEYEKMKDVLHEALIMAQKSADDKVKSAQGQADKIIADARKKADEICGEALNEEKKLRESVMMIKKLRSDYAQEFRGILGKFDGLLSQCVNSSPLSGVVENVLDGMDSEEPEPEDEPQSAERPDLEAAYNMLGVNPRDILKSNQEQED